MLKMPNLTLCCMYIACAGRRPPFFQTWHYAALVVGPQTLIKIIPRGTERMNEWMKELQYHDVSTYLPAWYKGEKNDSPIELGVWPRTTHTVTTTRTTCTLLLSVLSWSLTFMNDYTDLVYTWVWYNCVCYIRVIASQPFWENSWIFFSVYSILDYNSVF
jgi:hypothetical protein